MRKVLVISLAGMAALSAQAVVIDFDTDGNWTAGSGILTSYQSDHVYQESGWTFTGGPALRETAGTQDGFDRTLGTYSWRLRNEPVTWTATSTAAGTWTGFSLDVRRWDGSPSPAFDVAYTVNGGGVWTSVGTIDNAFLGDSSDWKNFGHTFASPETVAANQFVVRLQATGTTERIMVDNFSAIPEPVTLGFLGAGTLVALAYRRRR